MKNRIAAGILAALLAGCAATSLHMIESTEMPDSWERRISAGEMGKADYASGELQNLDIWPRLMDPGPVDYTPGCEDYLRKREEPLQVLTRFRVSNDGRVDSLTVLSDAYACRKSTVEMIETFRFLPGKMGNRTLSSVLIYPVNFSVLPDSDGRPE